MNDTIVMGDVKKFETKLYNLQNDIELLQKKINLADSERRMSSVNNKADVKKNSLEMKQLRMQVEELEVRLQKQQMNDCELMQDALHEKFRKLDDYKGKSSKEILQMVESNVLELNNKNQNLSHRLQILERSLLENQKALKEMTENCQECDSPSEADCLQQKRHLQSEQYKITKNIEECLNAKEKMKQMLDHLRKKQKSHLILLMDLKKEKRKMKNVEESNSKEEASSKDVKETCLKEKEYVKLNNEITVIKDATGCYDIHDIDSTLLEQRAIKEDLTTMIKQAENHLVELKEEKNYLDTKRCLMKETSSVCVESEECLVLARRRRKEQEVRRETANTELEKLDYVSNQTRENILRLIIKMQPKINKEELSNKDTKHLLKQLEKAVKYTFPHKGYSINLIRNTTGLNLQR